jgi:hypothetical protein
MRIPYISFLAAGAMALGGCAYDGLGMGLGYGNAYGPYGTYGGYGYGGPSVSVGYSSYSGGYGYGSPYGGYGYGSPYYGGLGSPYGWYDNFYYPGTGYYVYDTYRQPHVMTTTQRQYWTSRSPALRSTSTTMTTSRPNWSGFDRQTAQTRQTARQTARAERQTTREQRQQVREEREQQLRANAPNQ